MMNQKSLHSLDHTDDTLEGQKGVNIKVNA